MPWMLQPGNYTQVLRPNWVNFHYRRTGVYKGMGRLGQSDPNVTTLQVGGGYLGVPTQVSADGTSIPTNIFGLNTPGGPLYTPLNPAPSGGLSGNTIILIAAGALVLLLIMSRR